MNLHMNHMYVFIIGVTLKVGYTCFHLSERGALNFRIKCTFELEYTIENELIELRLKADVLNGKEKKEKIDLRLLNRNVKFMD